MKAVEAIKNLNDINRLRKIMLASNDYLYALLFTYGINTGLRISDILKLKFQDILDERKRVKSSFEVVEQKTGKKRKIVINDSVRGLSSILCKLHFLSIHKYSDTLSPKCTFNCCRV